MDLRIGLEWVSSSSRVFNGWRNGKERTWNGLDWIGMEWRGEIGMETWTCLYLCLSWDSAVKYTWVGRYLWIW